MLLKGMIVFMQAISLSPTKALPHVACCISMGRLAVFSDNKTKACTITLSCPHVSPCVTCIHCVHKQ